MDLTGGDAMTKPRKASGQKKLHVIFDMDGTLMDTEWETSVITADLAREKGWDISTEDVFRNHAGLGAQEKFSSIAKVFGATPTQSDLEYLGSEHERRKALIYQRPEIPMMPNAAETLQDLTDKGVDLSVGSSNPSARSKLGLDKTGLRKHFNDAVFGPDNVDGKKKPDPAVFLKAMFEKKSTPKNTVVIEDSEPGMQAGRAAGAVVVALLDHRFGNGAAAAAKAAAFRKAGADIIIRDLAELKDYIAPQARQRLAQI
jgi:HAD superfamily hydrolase (TIGR01509 family)